MKTAQQSLFPESYYIGKILESCKEKERLNNTVKVSHLIRITPLLNEFRKEHEGVMVEAMK